MSYAWHQKARSKNSLLILSCTPSIHTVCYMSLLMRTLHLEFSFLRQVFLKERVQVGQIVLEKISLSLSGINMLIGIMCRLKPQRDASSSRVSQN